MSRNLRGINMASSHKSKAPALTHFLCIPLVTTTSRPQLSRTIASFRDDVTRPKALGGFELPLDAVRPVGTLHLTLGMMSFPKDEGLDKAAELLKSLKLREIMSTIKPPVMPGSSTEEMAKDQPRPQITLKGLHTFQKADKATVLFAAPTDQTGLLHGFSEKIKALFKDAGLLSPDDRPLLLHATIVNTIYVKGNRKKRGDRNFITDAQAIMDRYEDQVWLEAFPLQKIAICRMSAKPIEEYGAVVDAAYEVEAEVEF
jgi:activating signal cointegrator complex subunit 1